MKSNTKKCCKNCYYAGRSGGGFFYECLNHGFQINNEEEECCEEYEVEKSNKGLTKKEAYEMARDVKEGCTEFNNLNDEVGFDLYQFEVDDKELNLFAYIRKGKYDEPPACKYYAVYWGVEYVGGDNIYTDYDTVPLTLKDLASKLYELANEYKNEDAIRMLKEMM